MNEQAPFAGGERTGRAERGARGLGCGHKKALAGEARAKGRGETRQSALLAPSLPIRNGGEGHIAPAYLDNLGRARNELTGLVIGRDGEELS